MKNTDLNQGVILLVMDIQKRIMESVSDPGPLLKNIENALSAARSAGIPVVYVALKFRPGYPEVHPDNIVFAPMKNGNSFTEGDEAADIHPAVAPKPNDIVVIKKRYSAFAGSDLDIVLRSMKATQLILTGFSTSGVVLSTVRAAADKDYRQIILSDGCADRDKETHEFLISKILNKQAAILTTNEWISSLN